MIKLPTSFEERIRLASEVIIAGLSVEFLTLFWTHSLSFTLFAAVGVPLTAAGLVLVVWAIAALRK